MSDFKSQFKAAKAVRGSGSSAKLVSRWLSWHDIALTTRAAYYLSTYPSYVTVVSLMQSKEQIRALKAQRAAAEAKAAEEAAKQKATQVSGFPPQSIPPTELAP